MAQHDFNVDGLQTFPNFEIDLNNALLALGTNSSGNSAPIVTYGNQLWVDTSTSPATLKLRNAANTAWISLGTASSFLGVTPTTIGSAFTARRNSNQNIPHSTLVKIIFNEELYDTHNQYNPTTGVFTCVVPGFYTFHSACRFKSTSPGTISTVFYQMLKNNNLAMLQDNPENLIVNVQISKAQYSSYMNVGDTLENQVVIVTSNSTAATLEYLPDYELAHFSGYRVA